MRPQAQIQAQARPTINPQLPRFIEKSQYSGVMTPGLQLGPGLTLPIEAVTQTFAIVAMRGAGKTCLAKVLVESMLAASLRVCVLDPLGVFWGLRSSADGKHPGEPVVIFGGDRRCAPRAHGW